MRPVPESRNETLADLLKTLWRGRFFVFTGCMGGLVLAAFFLFIATPYKKAHMIVMPALSLEATGQSSNAPDTLRRIQNAAANPADRNFEEFQAKIHGAAVASLLLRSSEIPEGLARDRAFRFSSAPPRWTPETLAEYIQKRVIFAPIGETRMREMIYYHPDPKFAAAFLQKLHSVTDALIRYTVRKGVEERIAYLQRALHDTQNPEHRRAVTDLLMEQERLKMLVSIDQPYTAAIIEPAFVSSKTLWPDAALVVTALCLLGCFSGFTLFQLRIALSAQTPVQARATTAASTDPERLKEKLGGLRGWHAPKGENNNQRPLTKKKPFLPPDAAE